MNLLFFVHRLILVANKILLLLLVDFMEFIINLYSLLSYFFEIVHFEFINRKDLILVALFDLDFKKPSIEIILFSQAEANLLKDHY